MLLQIYGFPITCYGLPVPGFPARLRQSCAIVAPRLHQGYIALAPALHQARGSQIIQNLYPESSRIVQIPFGSLRIFILNLLISSRVLYQNHPESTEIIKKYIPDSSITIGTLKKDLLLLLPKPIVPFSVLCIKAIVPFSVLCLKAIVQIFGTMP